MVGFKIKPTLWWKLFFLMKSGFSKYLDPANIDPANPFQDRFKRPLSGRMVCYGPPTRLHWDGSPGPVCVEPNPMVVRQHRNYLWPFEAVLKGSGHVTRCTQGSLLKRGVTWDRSRWAVYTQLTHLFLIGTTPVGYGKPIYLSLQTELSV